MEETVAVPVSEARLRRFLEVELPEILSGREPDPYGILSAALARVAVAAMEDVRDDYLRKSQGQAGEDGVTWEPLSEYTLKQRGDAKKGQSGSGQHSESPYFRANLAALSQTRREIYQREFARLRQGNVPAKEARRQASLTAKFLTRSAWAAQAAAIKKGLPGSSAESPQDFLILVDTERLLTSASPGSVSGKNLGASYVPSGEDQRVEINGTKVAVFSDVPYGDDHMADGYGSVTGGFRPARPWKYGDNVPEAWVARWAKVFAEALGELIPQAASQLTE